MNVAVFGLGYIGLPTASMLARAGHHVTGVDVDAGAIEKIRGGCAHVTEDEVRGLVESAIASGYLRVTTHPPDEADAYIICVPTPTKAHKPDLRYVADAAAVVAERARPGNLIILESTVPPGTLENVVVRALECAGKSAGDFHLAHCPERVIPGRIVHELRHNARVIGGRRPMDAEKVRALYATFCSGELCVTDALTAELVKVVENTFRDVNLAFANELAVLSQALGADAWEVIRLANMHPRVEVLNPGPGVGGHCIPVDPTFLANANPFLTELIQTARRVNERMPHVVLRLIDDALGPLRNGPPVIALLGAAYKADVDDTRESPSAALCELLNERHYTVRVYDPLASRFQYPLCETIEESVRGADVLVLMTDHALFRLIDPSALVPLARQRLLLDTRNFLDRAVWHAAGFTIRTLGKVEPEYRVQTSRTA